MENTYAVPVYKEFVRCVAPEYLRMVFSPLLKVIMEHPEPLEVPTSRIVHIPLLSLFIRVDG